LQASAGPFGTFNIVVSRRPGFRPEGCLAARRGWRPRSRFAGRRGGVFIIGGGQLYRKPCRSPTVYLTVVPLTVDGDAFFPEIPADVFAMTSAERIPGPPAYNFFIYDRIQR
jgi:dihydrofolate reductase